MTVYNQPMDKPCRGVIVVDACELKTLSPLIFRKNFIQYSPLEEVPNPTGTYLDILPVLARHGYKIIIPEMVAKEAADTLIGGEQLKFIFAKSREKYPTRKYVRQFCENVLGGLYPGIEIVAANPKNDRRSIDERPEYAQFLYKFSEILNSHLSKDDKREAIDTLEQSYKEEGRKQHFGDHQCLDAIAKEVFLQINEHQSTPIFFLSADDGARRELIKTTSTQVPPVNMLTAGGLLAALAADKTRTEENYKTDALKILGPQNTSLNSHWRHITSVHNDPKVPEDPIRENGYHDSSINGYNTGKFPFAESVNGLAVELAKESRQLANGHRLMLRDEDYLELQDMSDDYDQYSHEEKLRAKRGRREMEAGID